MPAKKSDKGPPKEVVQQQASTSVIKDIKKRHQAVELSVQCRNVMDWNVFSKANPMVVLFKRRFASEEFLEIGRTEVVQNSLNPDFVTKFVVDFVFEERQFLRFQTYDVTKEHPDLNRHDFIGQMDCTLGELLAAVRMDRQLTGPNVTRGSIIVTTEEQKGTGKNEEITLRFSASKLDKKDFFGSSDPFMAFYKVVIDGKQTLQTLVHKTEYIKHTVTPHWKPITVTAQQLCGGDRFSDVTNDGEYVEYEGTDINRPLIVKVYDWNRNGTEKLIGEFGVTLGDLLQGAGHKWELINPDLKGKKTFYKNSGYVTLNEVDVKKVPQFAEYVHAGTQLLCTVAIDFTASNGDKKNNSSWHYIHPVAPNWYARALHAVMEILQDYDSDKLYPVYGFGARPPGSKTVSHCFHANLNKDDPECQGVYGVLDAYQRCVKAVEFSGPTYFAPIIRKIADQARTTVDGSEYHILLILTCGEINDMPETRDAIVEAANFPISIIIVGIGNANFDAMVQLDGDVVRLTNQAGEPAIRDIVQFVPFRDFVKPGQMQLDVSQATLAKEVLAEVPTQFLLFMKDNGIFPGQWDPNFVAPKPEDELLNGMVASTASAKSSAAKSNSAKKMTSSMTASQVTVNGKS